VIEFGLLLALRMASSQDIPPPPGECGLVPVTCTIYAAPGGSYASMEFAHVAGCPHAIPHQDAVVRALVASMGFTISPLLRQPLMLASSAMDAPLTVALIMALHLGYTPANL